MEAATPKTFDIPEFAAEIRTQVRACFFGVSEAIDRAIITPIPFIFNGLDPWPTVDSRGWWPARFADGTLCALVPQSTAILDAVAAVEPGTEIVLVGLAGSLGTLRIGDVVEVVEALQTVEVVRRTALTPLLFPAAKVVGVRCLSESMNRWQTLATAADCVDMETSIVYAAACAQRKPATSILIISDELPQHPFYTVHPIDTAQALVKIAKALQHHGRDSSGVLLAHGSDGHVRAHDEPKDHSQT